MSHFQLNKLTQIINIWLGFILLLTASAMFPNWHTVSLNSWVNDALYFLAFLFALSIAVQDPNHKDVFFNLTAFLFSQAMTIIPIFIIDNFFPCSNNSIVYYFISFSIVSQFCMHFFIVFIVIKYLRIFQLRRFVYLSSFLILIPLYWIVFKDILTDISPLLANTGSIYHLFYNNFLTTNGFAFIFILFYGIHLYRNDHTIGRYIHPLMAFFFLFIISKLLTYLSFIYDFYIIQLDQKLLTVNLIFLIFILLKRTCFLCTDYGQFYERMLHDRDLIRQMKIEHAGWAYKKLILDMINYYLMSRKHYVCFFLFLLLLISDLLKLPRYFTLSFISIFAGGVVLYLYINLLYKRRSRNPYIS